MKSRLVCFLIAFTSAAAVQAAESWRALVSPANSLEFKFLKGDAQVAHLAPVGWGPNWQWVGIKIGRAHV